MSTCLKDFLITKHEVPVLTDGYSETLSEFWNTVVEPFLPEKSLMEKMYSLLIDYCELDDTVFAIRKYSNGSKKLVEEEKRSIDKKAYSTLRRGFLTKVEGQNGFSYFFTDNFFTDFFLEMITNGYVPELDEFKEMMFKRQFPARFGPFDKQYEYKKAAYSINGKVKDENGKEWKIVEPRFNSAGYKISHIFDCNGESYWIDGKEVDTEKLFPRGKYEEWKKNEKEGCYIRQIRNLSEEKVELCRRVAKAHFMRIACPLNYVLTPKANNQLIDIKVDKNDIGEWYKFQNYAKVKFAEKYGDLYAKYLDTIMIKEKPEQGDGYNHTEVRIKYGNSISKPANISLFSCDIDDIKSYFSNNLFITDEKISKVGINDYIGLYQEDAEDYCSCLGRITSIRLINNGVDLEETLGRRYSKGQKNEIKKRSQQYKNNYWVITVDKYYKIKVKIPKNNNCINLSAFLLSDENAIFSKLETKERFSKNRETYKWNGSIYNKRSLAFAIVKDYVEKHDSITYQELNHAFDMKLTFDGRDIVQLYENANEDQKKNNRISKEKLELDDGSVIVVNTQWQKDDMPEFLELLKNMGYSVKVNKTSD